jgi:hypothetical protein
MLDCDIQIVPCILFVHAVVLVAVKQADTLDRIADGP